MAKTDVSRPTCVYSAMACCAGVIIDEPTVPTRASDAICEAMNTFFVLLKLRGFSGSPSSNLTRKRAFSSLSCCDMLV